MKRMEIIFSQSIDEDFVQKCAEKDVGKFFTKILLRYLMKRFPKYKISQEAADLIANASALHDIGKIAISDNILTKPGKLIILVARKKPTHNFYIKLSVKEDSL